MVTCKFCGYNFHYCDACDYDEFCSRGYCSEECYQHSEDMTISHKVFMDLYSSLNDDQRSIFTQFLEEFRCYPCEHEKWREWIHEET